MEESEAEKKFRFVTEKTSMAIIGFLALPIDMVAQTALEVVF